MNDPPIHLLRYLGVILSFLVLNVIVRAEILRSQTKRATIITEPASIFGRVEFRRLAKEMI